jgi:hypothetical protein
MTVILLDTRTLRARTLAQRVDLHLAAQGMGFNPFLDRCARMAELEALDRLCDAELARRGLTREGLVAHVFAP